MALARCLTFYDRSEVHLPRAKDPCAHVREIASRDSFAILTTLLWVRDPTEHRKVPSTGINSDLKEQRRGAVSESQPDLGLLGFHRDRLVTAAEALGWRHIKCLGGGEQGLNTLRSSIQAHLDSLPELPPNTIEKRRMRITVDKSDKLQVGSTVMSSSQVDSHAAVPFMPKTLQADEPAGGLCQVIVDTQPTLPSLFTTHKTVHRPHYDAARQRVDISAAAPTEKEVLLYNPNGEISEASLCTVYFHRNGLWITPAAICGGVLGVTRRLAIENGLCKQGIIELSDLNHGELIWLSNAARGFFIGRLHLSEPPHITLPMLP